MSLLPRKLLVVFAARIALVLSTLLVLPHESAFSCATSEVCSLSRSNFAAWQREKRSRLKEILGIVDERVPLAAEKRGEAESNGIVIERWVFTSERGSLVPAVLYRPKAACTPMPAIVFTYGHGGSKSHWSYNYAGLLYAKLGLVVLAIDPIGEEERHPEGRRGTREHDHENVDTRAAAAGRLIMGKLVFDTMRGIDFLQDRPDVDRERIGVVGYSLGGAVAGWMAAFDPRVKMAIVAGWAYDDAVVKSSKLCTRIPNSRMRELCSWAEYASLGAPNCSVLLMNGDADTIIDRAGDQSAWKGTKDAVATASQVYSDLGASGAGIECWFEPEGGHRPYFADKPALVWIHKVLGTPDATEDQIQELPTINAGRWCDAHGIRLEKLYGTELHDRGASLVDLKLTPTPREKLKCLKPDEVGSSQFTIAGWLDVVAASSKENK